MSGLDIKLERVRFEVRQYQLAAALGLPPATLWQIESGRRVVTADEADRIASALWELAHEGARRQAVPSLRSSGGTAM
jgi:transcriptional regulator with XRE-family HTH domain